MNVGSDGFTSEMIPCVGGPWDGRMVRKGPEVLGVPSDPHSIQGLPGGDPEGPTDMYRLDLEANVYRHIGRGSPGRELPAKDELAQLALEHGAPTDIAAYQWIEARDGDGNALLGAACSDGVTIKLLHFIPHRLGTIAIGWNEPTRRAIYTVERPGLLPRGTPGRLIMQDFAEPAGISVDELAHRLGVSVDYMSMLIRGKETITPAVADRLAELFEASAGYWLFVQRKWDQHRKGTA